MGDTITVHKLDHTGKETFSYSGRVIERGADSVTLEAIFQRERMELGYVTLKPGDRFVEHYYASRWYNVFAIYDVEDGSFKGWYCNITRPAEISEAAGPGTRSGGHIRAVDLALDYFLQPSGREFILDQDEFSALYLSPQDAAAARAALAELRALAAQRAGPFART